MSARQIWGWATALVLHLLLIAAVSLEDISASLANGGGAWPAWLQTGLQRTQVAAATTLGRGLDEANPLRQVLATYTGCSGIEAGYSYFAPAIPPNGRLSFELYYPDGRVEYDLPPVGGTAAGYRISTLLDRLQNIHNVRLREAILKTLAYSVRREHPHAKRIRARFEVANLPSISDYRKGARVSYRTLYAYDFRFFSKAAQPVAK